jgi:hypothetical protein
VLLVDEGQEMQLAVLSELRLLASARLDSHPLLTRFSSPSDPTPPQRSVDDRILAALQDAGRALTIGELRPLCRVHNATLYLRLAALTGAGHLLRTPEGYRLVGRD